MQEVFSKIIEKLEERTSFLSDCTKYGNKDADQQNKSYSTMMMYEVSDLADDLIEIVKQAAEECKHGHFGCNSNGEHEKCSKCCDYDCKNRNREWFGAKDDNNGWISCSERFPEKYNRVLAYTDAGGYYIAHVNGCGKFVCTAECVSTVIENSDVIAWKPLPASYHPKGE